MRNRLIHTTEHKLQELFIVRQGFSACILTSIPGIFVNCIKFIETQTVVNTRQHLWYIYGIKCKHSAEKDTKHVPVKYNFNMGIDIKLNGMCTQCRVIYWKLNELQCYKDLFYIQSREL